VVSRLVMWLVSVIVVHVSQLDTLCMRWLLHHDSHRTASSPDIHYLVPFLLVVPSAQILPN